MKHYFRTGATLGTLAGLSLALAGCGKQEFVVTQSTVSSDAPGFYNIPAKVDILLAVDDTGSMSEIYGKLQSQFPGFLDGLEKKGWNYRMVATPLTQASTINQIAASKYDPNWGSQWKAPYPGAPITSADMVDPTYFALPAAFSGYMPPINNNLQGREPGFLNIAAAMNQFSGLDFLRSDALLMTIVIGNGNDTSGVNYCPRPSDGVMTPCADNSAQNSLNQYLNTFRSMKPSGLSKFYAAISKAARNNCLGGPAWRGERYESMSAAMGGQSYDVCVTPLDSVLAGMSDHLQSIKKGFRTKYIILTQEPEESTIQITKEDADGTHNITMDSANGWTYVGKVDGVYTIDHPIQMNLASGYAIELHGEAKLTGDENATITFLPKGASNSK